ncbi:MAG: DUF4143 domain-containing protein [Chthoniobacterales bacterium]
MFHARSSAGGNDQLSQTGNSLGIDGKTVRHYIDLLEGLYLIRRLPAWSRNTGKRIVKSSKFFWRDTGLLHHLHGLENVEQLLGHPVCGHSWEGYCLAQILATLPPGVVASHYRTQAGAEVDLVWRVWRIRVVRFMLLKSSALCHHD